MDNSIEQYWQIRLEDCRKALEANNFEAYIAEDRTEAKRLVLKEILPQLAVRTVSWGDSLTLQTTGILEALKSYPNVTIIKTFEEGVPWKEIIERRRQALLTDLFLTGSNAVTEDGKLVNLDMIGNRVAAITFGPKRVIILVGRNKIVPDVEQAMRRVRDFAAPANAIRHEVATPCVKTSRCHDCSDPQRICNTWTITEKSLPKARIKVILINEALGF